MHTQYELSVVIPTCPQRSAKLRTLLEGLATTRSERNRFEILLVVDECDPAPLQMARAVLPDDIRLRGFTQEHAGPARARNLAITHAEGDWLLFLDDDVILDGQTIPRQLAHIRGAPDAALAYLGDARLPPQRLVSPWLHLLDQAPLVFFWNDLRPNARYDFRYFWTCQLSVRTELVREVQGFDERFPDAMHEDIELGWRLGERFGLQVEPRFDSHSWHDHPLSPHEYFLREYFAGRSAAAAQQINPAFFQAVWGKLEDPHQALSVLRSLLAPAARQIVQLAERWATSTDHRPGPDELQAMYLAHLPLKRMLFCQGFVGRPFAELWETLR